MQNTCSLEEPQATRSTDTVRDSPTPSLRSRDDIGWAGLYDARTLQRPGGLLMSALVVHATARGESIAQMAQALGFSYPYINLLLTGSRSVSQASNDFILACALYLKLPRLTVMLLAGHVTPEDHFELERFNARMLEPAMNYIAADPEYSGLLTAQLRSASALSKFCIIKMYERATGRRLLAEELDRDAVVREVAQLQAQVARDTARLKARRPQD